MARERAFERAAEGDLVVDQQDLRASWWSGAGAGDRERQMSSFLPSTASSPKPAEDAEP
jgi:hypothetical protein